MALKYASSTKDYKYMDEKRTKIVKSSVAYKKCISYNNDVIF